MKVIIGIESTAHTFGVGVVSSGKILANQRDMYKTKAGGIIPSDAANHHRRVCNKIYKNALKEAMINETEIIAVAFSQGPGLPPCLLAGRDFARDLSLRLNKPLIPVNHCVAHLEIGRITGAKDPVLLYCSGANTQVIAYAAKKFRIFGETLDIGVGNFIDNFARYAQLGFPGGPKIEKIALEGKKFIELPYRVKGMDIALSGVLTNLRQKLEKGKNFMNTQKDKSIDAIEKDYTLDNLAYSMQETVFAMLVETAERALAHINKKELLLGGGVSCNLRLQKMSRKMCDERGVKFFCPPKSVLVDNGAMIAYLGEIIYKSEIKNHKLGITEESSVYWERDVIKNIDILPKQRTDQVKVTWK